MALPKGQYDLGYLPRFGLPEYTNRFPRQTTRPTLWVDGRVENALALDDHLQDLQPGKQVSDFHCVTTWSCENLQWQGIRFRDLYEKLIIPMAKPHEEANWVVFKCQDGYRARMHLNDLLAADVMLADHLNGKKLTMENGAPHRLVAPAHYGYKNAKHVKAIEFHRQEEGFSPPNLRFLEHPRARVKLEERGSGAPGWLLRYLYRPLVGSTIKRFAKATAKYHRENG